MDQICGATGRFSQWGAGAESQREGGGEGKLCPQLGSCWWPLPPAHSELEVATAPHSSWLSPDATPALGVLPEVCPRLYSALPVTSSKGSLLSRLTRRAGRRKRKEMEELRKGKQGDGEEDNEGAAQRRKQE